MRFCKSPEFIPGRNILVVVCDECDLIAADLVDNIPLCPDHILAAGTPEERKQKYMQAYDAIFSNSGLFFIVDIFREKFPNLSEDIVISVFDEWKEINKPIDTRMNAAAEKFDITMQGFFQRLTDEDQEEQE